VEPPLPPGLGADEIASTEIVNMLTCRRDNPERDHAPTGSPCERDHTRVRVDTERRAARLSSGRPAQLPSSRRPGSAPADPGSAPGDPLSSGRPRLGSGRPGSAPGDPAYRRALPDV